MLTKIIDLGAEFAPTGEPRVRLMSGAIDKTASAEIQKAWDTLPREADRSYLWVIGVSALEYYGCNNNGDAFEESWLKSNHEYFPKEAHVFLHHVNRDPAKSIGRPVLSFYNAPMHRVEMFLAVDKTARGAAEIVSSIKAGSPLYVSMGCRVAYDVCSICGNKAVSRAEYCDHLRYNMRKILPDGRQVYALNPDPHFFDISMVSRPADPTAVALDKAASPHRAAEYTPLSGANSAELGEAVEAYQEKLSALRKLSDIIKHVEAEPVEGQDEEGHFPVVRDLARKGFQDFDWPDFDHGELRDMRVSPAGLFAVIRALGGVPTLGDAAYMADGNSPSVFALLPSALAALEEIPEMLDSLPSHVVSRYGGELDEPDSCLRIVRAVEPVITARIEITRRLSPSAAKLAAAPPISITPVDAVRDTLSMHGDNFTPVEFVDRNGRVLRTSPWDLRTAQMAELTDPTASKGKIIGAALALGALSAVFGSGRLVDRLAGGALLGAPALAALAIAKKDPRTFASNDLRGPVSFDVYRGARKVEKTAAGTRLSFGTMAGALAPAALAMDYAFNRWKYSDYGGENPYATKVDKTLTRAGEKVLEHPFLSVFGGAAAGEALAKGVVPELGRQVRKVFTRG